jgi:hypothetical protein
MLQATTEILSLKPNSGIGNAPGQRLLADAKDWFTENPPIEEGTIVAFDLSDIEFATTSFVKTSILPLYQSARLSTETNAQTMSDAFGLPAWNAFPVIVNARPEVEELTDEIFGRRGFPLLSLKMSNDNCFSGGRLIGFLDDVLIKTMRAWPGIDCHTAASLHEKFSDQGITQTAWSNRLNDLWRVRLLRRFRQGKSWKYQPIAMGVNYYG